MAFSVSFYNISDPPNKLNKTLPENAAHVAQSASPYEPMSELTGKIILAYVAEADGCNYCSITEGSVTQYYFITDTVLLPGGKFEIYLKRDVLMTYESSIKNMEIYVTRCAKQASVTGPDAGTGYNAFLEDPEVRITAAQYVREFPFIENGGTFEFKYPTNINPGVPQYVLGVIG